MPVNSPVLDWVPDLFAFLRRSWRIVLLCTAVTIALGIVYFVTATSSFTASSTVLIDAEASAPFKQQSSAMDGQYANGVVESQVEVLQSVGLARDVVRALRLADDPVFLANGRSPINTVLGVLLAPFATPMPDDPQSHETGAAELLIRMSRVRRIGMSFILELDVTSRDARLSSRLANAMVDAFVNGGLDAKNVNTKRASLWLQQRIGELQSQAVVADRAVQAFKAEAGIVDTDKGLMNQRYLGELNSQIVLARTRVADAKARLDRIREIIQAGPWAGDVSDALQNAVITHLREQYVDAARQAAEWEARVGPNHAVVTQTRDKLKDIQAQIRSELQRIAEGTESDYRVALTNQRDIERQLDGLVADADRTNLNLVRLRELQSAADTYRTLSGNFLQRYTQAVQDQSFPISDVRIVTHAATPLRKSWPKALIVLAGAAVAGLSLGFTVALVRESFDHGLRTAAQVRTGLELPCLGVLPTLKFRRRTDRAPVEIPTGDRRIVSAPPILRQVMLSPLSPYAEAIRGLRIRLMRPREGRREVSVIGFVSALPEEGKSTVSANFAFFLAEAGFRTLLVDWDFRKHSLSRLLAPTSAAGFAEIVGGSAQLADVVWRDPVSGLAFLPAAAAKGVTVSEQARGAIPALSSLNGPRAQALLASLREQFDYVVIDLPAMLPVADAVAATRLVDGVVMVVECGRTSQAVVQECIEHASIEPQSLLGVVLNKADLDTLHHYPSGVRAYDVIPLSPA